MKVKRERERKEESSQRTEFYSSIFARRRNGRGRAAFGSIRKEKVVKGESRDSGQWKVGFERRRL